MVNILTSKLRSASLSASGFELRSRWTLYNIVKRFKSSISRELKKKLFSGLNEIDNGQVTTNPYILVKRALKGDGPITLDILNGVLAHQGFSLSEDDFNMIQAIEPVELEHPLPKGDRKVMALIGSSKKKGPGVPGAYVFTQTDTGKQYAGGTSNLAVRPRYYSTAKGVSETRTIARLMALHGPSAFTLQVYVIDLSLLVQPVSEKRIAQLALALEQYLILHLKTALNDTPLVNGIPMQFGGSEALARIAAAKMVPMYVYNKDMDKLVYKAKSRAGFISLTGLQQSTINRRLGDGELLLYTYKLSSTLFPNVEECLMSDEEMKASINTLFKNRMKLRNAYKSHSPSVKNYISISHDKYNANVLESVYRSCLGHDVVMT